MPSGWHASSHDPLTRLLGFREGKQEVLVNVPVTVGEQYRLGTLTFRSPVASAALIIPVKTLREQFNLGQNDLFSVAEIRTGLGSYRHFISHADTQRQWQSLRRRLTTRRT
jgi:outer membrane protein assembly factor BamA